MEEVDISIDFVLAEIFHVVYRAKFFERGYFLRRDPRHLVKTQVIRFHWPQTEAITRGFLD